MVTDRQSWELDPQQSPFVQDAIAPKGILALRGNPAAVGSAPGANPLVGVFAADIPVLGSGYQQVAVADVAGNVYCYAAPTWYSAGGLGSLGLIREIYRGEFIICPQDGKNPVRRFAGVPNNTLPAIAAAGGTIATTANSTVITGTGTNFTTQAPVGSYLLISGIHGYAFKVVKVNSATSLSVETLVPVAVSGVSWAATYLGQFGLSTPVSWTGTATFTSASTAVTGTATAFNSQSLQMGQPAAGDAIGPIGNYTGLSAISTITSDTALTLTAGAAITATSVPYIIFRNMVGREARVHMGTLFITGIDWLPNHIYSIPTNQDLGAQTNGIYSYAADYVDANIAIPFTVPSPQARGRIVALLSTPEGMLVLRNDSAWMMYGLPPTQTTVIVADGAGCIDLRSAISTEYGQFWCGMDGVYRYTGGRIVDLAAQGGRSREWRALMRTWYGNITDASQKQSYSVSCGVMDGHLLVGVVSATGTVIDQVWVYDLIADCWRSTLTAVAPTSFSKWNPFALTATYLGTTGEALYFVQSTQKGADANSLWQDNGMLRDEGAITSNNAYNGVFICDIPESAAGSPADLDRVIEEKVVYELTGGGAATRLVLQSGVDGGALGTDASLAATSAGPQEARIRPQTDVTQAAGGALGLNGRRHAHRITQTGQQPSALRLHEVDLVVRQRRPRA
jgi:hypothetical protein